MTKDQRLKNIRFLRMKSFFIIILGSMVFSLGFLVCIYAEEINKILARVNNEVITSKDLDDYQKVTSFRLPEETEGTEDPGEKLRKHLLARLIEDRLILDEAKKESIRVPFFMVEDKLEEIIKAHVSYEEFEKALLEKGLNVTRLRERIKEQYLVQKVIDRYVRAYVRVLPQEISESYKNNLDVFGLPARYVLWIAKSQDKGVLAQMAEVVNEKGIAEARSQWPDLLVEMKADKEGVKKDIAQALDEMKEGESLIKEIDRVGHFIYLDRVIARATVSLEEVSEKISVIIWDKKFKIRFQEWLSRLKSKALIKIYSVRNNGVSESPSSKNEGKKR